MARLSPRSTVSQLARYAPAVDVACDQRQIRLAPTLTLETANPVAILIFKHRRDLTDAR